MNIKTQKTAADEEERSRSRRGSTFPFSLCCPVNLPFTTGPDYLALFPGPERSPEQLPAPPSIVSKVWQSLGP